MTRFPFLPYALIAGFTWGCTAVLIYQQPKLLFVLAALLAYLGVELAAVGREERQ